MIPVEVRRSRGAKYLRVWVGSAQEVVLSMPWRTSYKEGYAFLNQNGDWIAEQLEKAPSPCGLLEYLRKGRRVSIGGESWSVRFRFQAGRTRIIPLPEERTIEVETNPHAETELPLYRALRDLAREVLTARTRFLAQEVQVRPVRVVVRNQKSRWGSCSGKREISLNWRLLFLKPALQDYVIYHELAHLKEMNHSERFWKLLARYDPQARRHDRMLTRAGDRLIVLGRGLD